MTTVLRSVLYMPGANDRALEKAKTIPCDGLILDLEDSVAPDAKPAAREAVCAAASSGEYGRRTVTIRVNSLGTEWHDADLAAAAKAGPDGIVVPKVNSAAEVLGLVEAMEKAGAPEHTKLWAMVETPEAIFNAREIAAASDRLAVIVMGTNDLVKELYAEHVPGRAPLMTSLSMALLADREPARRVRPPDADDPRGDLGAGLRRPAGLRRILFPAYCAVSRKRDSDYPAARPSSSRTNRAGAVSRYDASSSSPTSAQSTATGSGSRSTPSHPAPPR